MFYLIVVSLLWAFSFGLIKRYLGGVDSAFVTTIRLGLSLIVFLPFLRLRGVTVRMGLTLAAIGAVQFGVMYLAYIESFRYLHAYEAALFTITTPIFVTLLVDLFERTMRPRALIAALLAVVGTGIIVVKSTELKLTLAGLGLIQLSNVAFAFGQVSYRRLRKQHAALKDREIFALLYAGGVVVAVAALIGRGVSFKLTPPQLWTLLYLGVVASGLGFFLWNKGAVQVKGGTLAVMNNLKVPLAVVCALLFFGESADLPRLIASLLVLGAAVWLAEKN
ncbi:MAG: EamA family transporter [Lacunisphaera sp.]